MFTEMFTRTGAQVVAVDISPDLLKKARARNLPSSQVQFIEQRFEECDTIGPFDAVIGSSVLHHLDIQDALTKIFDLLKPGGILSFAEPNLLNPQVFLERKLSFIRPLFWYVSPDEIAFVRSSLRARMMKIGFEKIEIQPFDWLHPMIPSRLINFVNKLEKRLEKTVLLREFAGSLYIRACRPT
jgi:2-polyprenyl-3-methyl-5-hydroxy-6-metoxy-1,4-benzoquinol methylase